MGAGHACGHHLFGSGSVAAALAVKEWLASSGTPGTIRLYGTPAEEGGAGKVYLVRGGLFEDVDAVLHWHAGSSNDASPSTSLANKSAKFRFHGVSAHASGAPDQGRSALDGVEAMNNMVNMLREHVPMETRIHYVITSGGAAPNVVPDFAEVYYYVRNPDVELARSIFDRVVLAAEGAALGTGTRMEHEVIHGIYAMLSNETLQRRAHENLERVGGVEYTAEERAFAAAVQATLAQQPPLESAAEVQPYMPRAGGGSTDVADVSWVVPTVGIRTATWVPGTPAHSWQAIAAGGTTIGEKGMVVAAKALAMTAVDLFTDSDLLAAAKAEYLEKVGPGLPVRVAGGRPASAAGLPEAGGGVGQAGARGSMAPPQTPAGGRHSEGVVVAPRQSVIVLAQRLHDSPPPRRRITMSGDSNGSSAGNSSVSRFFERPILNNPYEYPRRHWELDAEGQPTHRILDGRRPAEFITPFPTAQQQGASSTQARLRIDEHQELSTDDEQYLTAQINTVRRHVDRWRDIPNPNDWGVTPTTARLLRHWRSHKFSGIRPFFCQVEAAETAIWLTEVAPRSRAKPIVSLLRHLEEVSHTANPGPRASPSRWPRAPGRPRSWPC